MLLTETVLFYCDCIDLNLRSQASTKNTITGVGEVKDWADKLASSKYLNTLPSQRSTSSNSRHARSISSGTGSLIKDPCATPLSSGTRLSTPTSDNLASESQECDSYIQGGDQGERKAMHNPSSKAVTQQTNVMVRILFQLSTFLLAFCTGHR